MKQRKPEIIVALDVPSSAQALRLVDQVGNACSFYKVGLELFAGGDGMSLSRELMARDKRVFADLKLLDIPATVARATARLAEAGFTFLTVHAQAAALQAAVAEAREIGILAVTLLTSVNTQELHDDGYRGSVEELVCARALMARDLGCKGVVCSAREARAVREAAGDDLSIVTPGIRSATSSEDDQKRTADISTLRENGIDYAVIGRPVRDAADPRAAAVDLRQRMLQPNTTS